MSLKKLFDTFDNGCEFRHGTFHWSRTGVGFGSFYFYEDDNGKKYISNEIMSRQFIKDVLCKLVDDSILDCPNRKDGDGTPIQDRSNNETDN